MTAIRIDNLTKRYRDVVAVDGLSLSIEEGEFFGIIGQTGSGKTTLVNLIAGLYSAREGAIYIDGKDVNGLTAEDKDRLVSIALQKPCLFKGTIKSNLLMGNNNASEEDMLLAIKTAQAEDVLTAKGSGLESEVEQGGRNFSGGQRQRLSLARAIVSKPEILILDDSASALDYATDAKLRAGLKECKDAMTTVIVSQRTSSIQHADKIVVLDDGKVAGIGTHKYLLEHCEVYQEIYDSQYQNPAEEVAADE
jgi:ABC-type multidrug transport system fused ATPase/permease subunit